MYSFCEKGRCRPNPRGPQLVLLLQRRPREWNITGIEKNPKSNPAFGEFWLTTDAWQYEPYPDGSLKKGQGYDIHLTPFTNTNGCLGIHDKILMNKLIELYCKNEEREPGTSKLKVYSNKTK